MPQCTGQCGRACCRLGVHPFGEPESPSQTLSVSLKDADSEWETKRAEIHLLSDISGWLPARAPPLPAPWPPPCWAQEQGTSHPTPSPPPQTPRAQTSKESRLLPHLCQPENHGHSTSERETLSEGWFFLPEKNQLHILYITLYVIVYNLLIPWWWCPCMEYLVFGFLKTAWNEMYNSQSYLCFCNCRDNSTLCRFILSPAIWFFSAFP